MALVITPIYTQTVSANGASSVVFNNIPQFYTDLQIVVSCRTTPTGYIDDGVLLRFNNDAGSNYSTTVLGGDGATASSGRESNATTTTLFLAPTSFGGNVAFGSSMGYIPNYTASTFKSMTGDAVNERNSSSILMRLNAGLWRSTDPITSISIFSSTFAQYSTFSLYGIIRSGA